MNSSMFQKLQKSTEIKRNEMRSSLFVSNKYEQQCERENEIVETIQIIPQ